MNAIQANLLDVEERTSFSLQRRTSSELSANERILLDKSGLRNLAPIEAWSFDGTNRDLSYSTHALFRYFGKFPPPIATHLIKSYTSEGDLVIDPMCGSGTTGVECLLLGRRGLLADVNPLSLLLSSVKTTYLPSGKLAENLNRILSTYQVLDDGTDYKYLPIGLRNAHHWFLPETIVSLRKLRTAIDKVKDPMMKDPFLVVFASTVRRASRATTQQGRLFLDAVTAEKDALPIFADRSESSIAAISGLPQAPTSDVKVVSCDVRDATSWGLEGTAQLVILHTPYFNGYKYSTINSLELAWLGYDLNQVRSMEIREFFKVGKEDNVGSYLSDMRAALLSTFELVSRGGRLALMIGDTAIHGEYVQVVKPLLDSLPQLRSCIEKIAIRVPRHTEASWVASQRRKTGSLGVTLHDFILVFHKK